MTAPAGYAVLWEFEGRTCVIDFDGEDALSISIGFAVALAEADEPRTNIRHVQIRLPELTEAEQARIAKPNTRNRTASDAKPGYNNNPNRGQRLGHQWRA